MAPESSAPKRKRGRPSNASKLDIDASQEHNYATEAYDTDAPDQMRAKKRGRPRKSLSSQDDEASLSPENSKPTKKRGRPSLGGKPRNLIHEDEATPPQQKRKRGRPSLKNRELEDEDTPRRGRARHSEDDSAAQDSEEDQLLNDTPTQKQLPAQRKRGRPSLQARREDEEEVPERGLTKGKQEAKPRKRGRPSLRDISVPNKIQSKPSDNAKGKTATDSPSNTASGRRRGRPTGSTRVSTRATAEDSPAPNKQRRPQDADVEDGEDDVAPSPSKPYPHVSPHINRVRQSTIESKWSPLPETTVAAANSMLVMAHRPVLQRLSGSEQRQNHTSAALRLVSHRITRKIARGIPFPPASMPSARVPRGRQAGAAPGAPGVTDGRATELDFESVLDAKMALERQLDPALHAVELLTREKEKLERELERDYETLRNLESSAKAQGREYRGLLKKAHVLAPTPETVHSQRKQKAEQEISFTHSGASLSGGLFSDLQDPELKSLALQLSDHMESIRSNLQQADGIVPQLARSRAALQDVLFRQLSQEQYERVVLG
ncbi:CENP-Q, a CENPA-CAD centromere complex subunit domain-containing protein [Trichoderma breve]|uniref:CENP-Q, a CENPA-CAD centromere complex subunit domain-containing protein n=1 Tax=Trichoderma breve TaxID=2034170 RepID=A0A9W9BCU0_9HYPO|nr:CENP-Q, a CENPA-CAD centromere complex subunit domain-containing protein [Trichoderma breve]KAJ4860903.1 CENP-Q, a CENPA-CAD centromere complex subunit domain-containing protein [Trichoderma breve]